MIIECRSWVCRDSLYRPLTCHMFRKFSHKMLADFPGGPGVKTLHSNVGDRVSVPGWETKVPCAAKYFFVNVWGKKCLHTLKVTVLLLPYA